MHINSSDCVQKCQRNDNFYITPRSRASAPIFTKQVRDQPPTYADNVALPAFARRCCSNRSISAENLQQRVCCCGPMRGQTDRRTDTVPFHRPCSAYYAGNASDQSMTKSHAQKESLATSNRTVIIQHYWRTNAEFSLQTNSGYYTST